MKLYQIYYNENFEEKSHLVAAEGGLTRAQAIAYLELEDIAPDETLDGEVTVEVYPITAVDTIDGREALVTVEVMS